MFERFTERGRRVIVLAQEEAKRLDHNTVGTEHILLGIIREGEGVASEVLRNLKIPADRVRAEVERMIGRGERPPTGEAAFSSRAKKVLELALDEARGLKHNYISTEHLLLGLIREEKGVAAQVLATMGLDLERARAQIVAYLEEERLQPPRTAPEPEAAAAIGVPEAERFLFAEARLLDERRFEEWEALFTDDGSYWVPIDPAGAPGQDVSIIADDRKRIHERVYRLTQTPVLDQNPPSRTIRFVSNVEVEPDGVSESRVRCRQLITEVRPGGLGQAGLNAVRFFPASCEYRLRRVGGAWRIVQKKVVLLDSDQPHYNLSFIP